MDRGAEGQAKGEVDRRRARGWGLVYREGRKPLRTEAAAHAAPIPPDHYRVGSPATTKSQGHYPRWKKYVGSHHSQGQWHRRRGRQGASASADDAPDVTRTPAGRRGRLPAQPQPSLEPAGEAEALAWLQVPVAERDPGRCARRMARVLRAAHHLCERLLPEDG